jgi:hypothetical protein
VAGILANLELSDNTTTALVSLPADRLLVSKGNPDGTIIDFGFEGGQIPTPLRPARSQAVRSTARGWPHPAAKARRAQDRRLGHLP